MHDDVAQTLDIQSFRIDSRTMEAMYQEIGDAPPHIDIFSPYCDGIPHPPKACNQITICFIHGDKTNLKKGEKMAGIPMLLYQRLTGKALQTAFDLAGMQMVAQKIEADDFYRVMADYGNVTLYDQSGFMLGHAYLLSPSVNLSLDDETLVVEIDGSEPEGDIQFEFQLDLDDLDAFVRPEKLKDFDPDDLELPDGLEINDGRFKGIVRFALEDEKVIKMATMPPQRKRNVRIGGWSGKVIRACGPPKVRRV